ncbi:MAG: ATP-binding protein [Bacteroidota bacterium]
MLGALTALHSYICELYAIHGGLAPIPVGPKETWDERYPLWQWQSVDLRQVSNPDEATGVAILDKEIGLCLFVQTYTAETDVRAQLSKALSIRSALVPSRLTAESEADPEGEWSVALLWLSEGESFAAWVDQVAELRQETAYFEEVSVDIVVNREGDWSRSYTAHGLPRLLLRTRASLRLGHLDESLNWLSADTHIVRRLRDLPNKLPPRLQPVAQAVVAEVELLQSKLSDVDDTAPVPAHPLHGISIQDFRNIEQLSLEFRASDELVSANIIQGPNGTGKSSISEALTLATSGVSTRYMEFLSDSNESTQGKPRKYLERYLAAINRSNPASPKLGLNARQPEEISLANADDALQKYADLSGTFLSQASGEALHRVRADSLGAQIAGDYSRIAARILEFIEARLKSAEAERAAFNREHGLRSNVSKDDTARPKIISNFVSGSLSAPRDVIAWLGQGQSVRSTIQLEFGQIAREWADWDKATSTREQLFASAPTAGKLTELIKMELTKYAALVHRTATFLALTKQVAAHINDVRMDLGNLVSAWGAWLRRSTSKSSPAVGSEISRIREQVRDAQEVLSALTKAGSVLREQIGQLKTVYSFVEQHWANEHPDTCPICATDLAARGGIATTIETIIASSEIELLTKRAEYVAAKKDLDLLVGQLSEVDSDSPPIVGESAVMLLDALRALMGSDFEMTWLQDAALERSVVEAVAFVGRPIPQISEVGNEDQINQLALAISTKIWEALNRFSAVSEAPDSWKAVQKEVISELTITIREHLPNTLQALWRELAFNIMPASWQYPGAVEFEVDTSRSQTEARLVVLGHTHSVLAAHILNEAELHNLSIAWFFTRYLTHGRHSYSFLVLDDPAQQMDQPTFRDFCRFLEAFVRMHKVRGKPLTLVLFLHQDERALDAARATDATIHYLRWHDGATSIVRKWKTRVAQIAPRKPYQLLRSA